MCHIVADGTKIPFFHRMSPVGVPCFIQIYDVVYTCGQTEFKAQLRWMEEVLMNFVLVTTTILIISTCRAKRNGASFQFAVILVD